MDAAVDQRHRLEVTQAYGAVSRLRVAALASALIGALGEGDLGRHFPSSDPALARELWPLLAFDAVDADAGTPGVQIVDDTNHVSPSGVWYYEVTAVNSVCGTEGPR